MPESDTMGPEDVNVAGVQFADDEATLPRAKEILHHVSKEFTNQIRAKNREMTQRREMQGSMMAYTRRTQELMRDRHYLHRPTRSRSPERFEPSRRKVALPSISIVDTAKSLSLTSKYFQTNTHLHRRGVDGGNPTNTEYKVQLVNPLSRSDPTGLGLDFVRRAEKSSVPEGQMSVNMGGEADGESDKKQSKKVKTKLVFLKDESQVRIPKKKKSKKDTRFEWVHTESRTLKISLQLPRVENEPDSPTISLDSMMTMDPQHQHSASESAISTCVMCSLANRRAGHANSVANSLDNETHDLTGGLPADSDVELDEDYVDAFSDSDSWPTKKSGLENPLLIADRATQTKLTTANNRKAVTNQSKLATKEGTKNGVDSTTDESGFGSSTDTRKKLKKRVRASVVMRKNRSMGIVPKSTPTLVKNIEKKKARLSPSKSRTKLKVLPLKDASQSLNIDDQSYHKSYKIIHHDPPSIRKLKSLMAGGENSNVVNESKGEELRVTTNGNKETTKNGESESSVMPNRVGLNGPPGKNTGNGSVQNVSEKQPTHDGDKQEVKDGRGKENEKPVNAEEILSRYNVELEQSSNPLKFPGGKITLSDVTSYVDDSYMQKAMMEDKRAMKRPGKMIRPVQNNGPCIHGNVKERCRSCSAVAAAEAMLGQQIEEFENTQLQWNAVSDKVDRLRWGKSKLMRGLPPPSTDTQTKASKQSGDDEKPEHTLGLPTIATSVEFSDNASLKSYLAGLNDSATHLSAGRLGKKVRFTEQVQVREIAIYRDSNKPLKKPRRGKKAKQQQRQEIVVNGDAS
ncbi:uncharacterized protein [Ptychodera flava]|uniref:uncharacterized protein n=1 Tax=Ptychodera flava TaxID=63121 RepID=UPI00396A5D06